MVIETRGNGPKIQAVHTKKYLAAIHAEQAAYADELEANDGYPPAIEALRAKKWRLTHGHTASGGRPTVPRPSATAFAPASWVEWTDAGTGALRRGVVVGPVEKSAVSIVPADGGEIVTADRLRDGVFVEGAAVAPIPAPK
ncbi:hypothetical protein [Embleya sp. NPDC005971]|uniref:hypothetical protein n=1 Tax=Embleya sp. NPDC005971 TaxID=3156724 RepID=UPI0033CA75F0